MEYLILAYDGEDSEAKSRRLAAREAHLAKARALKDRGNFVCGGALLDDDGNMIGSTLYMDFEKREELDQWLETDPYTVGGVWVKIEVKPIRLALRE